MPTSKTWKERARSLFRSRCSRTTQNALTTTLAVAEKVCSSIPVPGLQGMLGGLLVIIRGVEVAHQNDVNVTELIEHLDLLTDSILRPLSFRQASEIPLALSASLMLLMTEINGIAEECQIQSRRRSGWFKFVNRDDDTQGVISLNRRLKESIVRFRINGDINQRIELEQDRQRELIAKLPVVHAGYNSISRNQASTCMKNTRQSVLYDVAEWIESKGTEVPRIFWLNGIAGSGKSAIAQTVAKNASAASQLGASFFFTRAEAQLRSANALFSSLAYQLAHFNPHLRSQIASGLEAVPHAGHQGIQSQFYDLFLRPLSLSPDQTTPFLIVLDAVDECEELGGEEVLKLLVNNIQRLPSVIKIFISSRPEPHIRSLFEKMLDRSHVITVYLQEIPRIVVQQDIRCFLRTRLSTVPDEFPEAQWELTPVHLNILVNKCDSLFIIAATIVNFIKDRRARDPCKRLAMVLHQASVDRSSLPPPASAPSVPLRELDTCYNQVLRQSLPKNTITQDLISRFSFVVGTLVVLLTPLPLSELGRLLRIDTTQILAALEFLHSVISIPVQKAYHTPIRFYHQSFPEFLTDPTRCIFEEFCIKPEEHHRRLALICLAIIERDANHAANKPLRRSRAEKMVSYPTMGIRRRMERANKYALGSWALHLIQVSSIDPELKGALGTFLSRHLYYWIYRIEEIGRCSVKLRRDHITLVWNWATSTNASPRILKLLEDAKLLARADQATLSRLSDDDNELWGHAVSTRTVMTAMRKVEVNSTTQGFQQ